MLKERLTPVGMIFLPSVAGISHSLFSRPRNIGHGDIKLPD